MENYICEDRESGIASETLVPWSVILESCIVTCTLWFVVSLAIIFLLYRVEAKSISANLSTIFMKLGYVVALALTFVQQAHKIIQIQTTHTEIHRCWKAENIRTIGNLAMFFTLFGEIFSIYYCFFVYGLLNFQVDMSALNSYLPTSAAEWKQMAQATRTELVTRSSLYAILITIVYIFISFLISLIGMGIDFGTVTNIDNFWKCVSFHFYTLSFFCTSFKICLLPCGFILIIYQLFKKLKDVRDKKKNNAASPKEYRTGVLEEINAWKTYTVGLNSIENRLRPYRGQWRYRKVKSKISASIAFVRLRMSAITRDYLDQNVNISKNKVYAALVLIGSCSLLDLSVELYHFVEAALLSDPQAIFDWRYYSFTAGFILNTIINLANWYIGWHGLLIIGWLLLSLYCPQPNFTKSYMQKEDMYIGMVLMFLLQFQVLSSSIVVAGTYYWPIKDPPVLSLIHITTSALKVLYFFAFAVFIVTFPVVIVFLMKKRHLFKPKETNEQIIQLGEYLSSQNLAFSEIDFVTEQSFTAKSKKSLVKARKKKDKMMKDIEKMTPTKEDVMPTPF